MCWSRRNFAERRVEKKLHETRLIFKLEAACEILQRFGGLLKHRKGVPALDFVADTKYPPDALRLAHGFIGIQWNVDSWSPHNPGLFDVLWLFVHWSAKFRKSKFFSALLRSLLRDVQGLEFEGKKTINIQLCNTDKKASYYATFCSTSWLHSIDLSLDQHFFSYKLLPHFQREIAS